MEPLRYKSLDELLKVARVILYEELSLTRTQSYDAWKIACDRMWATKGVLLPYAEQSAGPTEQDVINKALELFNILNLAGRQNPVITPNAVVAQVPETIAINEEIMPIDEIVEHIPDAVDDDEALVEEPVYASLLTQWGGRGDYLEDLKNDIQ